MSGDTFKTLISVYINYFISAIISGVLRAGPMAGQAGPSPRAPRLRGPRTYSTHSLKLLPPDVRFYI